MTENEYIFAKNIVKLDENINRAIEYIKENFNMIAEYDEENNKLNIISSDINEDAQLSQINDYIYNKFGDYLITNIS